MRKVAAIVRELAPSTCLYCDGVWIVNQMVADEAGSHRRLQARDVQ